LEEIGILKWIVTQNVDGLHQKSGSKNVIELHGNLETVHCINCLDKIARKKYHDQLRTLNTEWFDNINPQELSNRPDGDVNVSFDFSKFVVPSCDKCRTGIMKPSIVFFGDNIPISTFENTSKVIKECDNILVVGSSLEVHSIYRLISEASLKGIFISILNIGKTRADNIADFKVEAKCGDVLPKVVQNLINGK